MEELAKDIKTTGDKFEDVLLYLEKGWGVDRSYKKVGLVGTAFYDRLRSDKDYHGRVTRAREVGNELEFEKMLEIAEEQPNQIYDPQGNQIFDRTHIQWKQQILDVRKWRLAIKNPQKYSSTTRVDSQISAKVETTIDSCEFIDGEEVKDLK